VLDRPAGALLRRLARWLDQFKDCFGHLAQHVSLRQYIDGWLGDSDSSPRKSGCCVSGDWGRQTTVDTI
jgi:hypothetical protein